MGITSLKAPGFLFWAAGMCVLASSRVLPVVSLRCTTTEEIWVCCISSLRACMWEKPTVQRLGEAASVSGKLERCENTTRKRRKSHAKKEERCAPTSRVKQDKPANEDPPRFVRPNRAVNGIANEKTSIQSKSLSDWRVLRRSIPQWHHCQRPSLILTQTVQLTHYVFASFERSHRYDPPPLSQRDLSCDGL